MTPRYGALPDQGCIEVRGADAAAFLHGQLSRTVDSLDASRAPLAGWHDAKGRVRALLRVVRLPDRWLLLAPRDVRRVHGRAGFGCSCCERKSRSSRRTSGTPRRSSGRTTRGSPRTPYRPVRPSAA